MMDQRETLIELLTNAVDKTNLVDHLLANGVVVLPCRCGECEYYIYTWESDDGQVYGLCDIHGTPDLKSANFCSYAKRKGGDE